jgi:uncharacterized protein (TIGR02996 family)
MTSEEDFQRALNRNPSDHLTRLVFADYLDELGDPRADGYRALGLLQLSPYIRITGRCLCFYGNGGYKRWTETELEKYTRHFLPAAWAIKLPNSDMTWNIFLSRRIADDTVADSWRFVSLAKREEILKAVVTESPT